jgi:hypothetical protein
VPGPHHSPRLDVHYCSSLRPQTLSGDDTVATATTSVTVLLTCHYSQVEMAIFSRHLPLGLSDLKDVITLADPSYKMLSSGKEHLCTFLNLLPQIQTLNNANPSSETETSSSCYKTREAQLHYILVTSQLATCISKSSSGFPTSKILQTVLFSRQSKQRAYQRSQEFTSTHVSCQAHHAVKQGSHTWHRSAVFLSIIEPKSAA